MYRSWTKRILILLLVIAVATACGGLSGEPEIVSTIPVRVAAPETFDQQVSLERGALVFAENCTRCHGVTGAGDGELAVSGEVPPMSAFTDPTTIQDMSLQAWFETITNGRLELLMPPWGDSLTKEDRWAVAFYTYTLSYDEASVAQGQEHYEALCADCHGLNGEGSEDGTALLGLVEYTEADLQTAVATHQTDLELSSPIPDEELASVVQYVRLLSSESGELPSPEIVAAQPQQPSQPEPATTEEAQQPQGASTPAATQVEIPESIGILRGQIIQGTAGGASVEGLEAIVHIYDSQLQEQIAEYIVGADGVYEYTEVVIRPDFAYRMTVNYNGITYASPVHVGDPNEAEMVIDVTIYDTGADEDALAITSRATQINLASNGLYVIEVIDMVNNSDRAYIREEVSGTSEAVSVGFLLPEGAELQLQHTDPNRILLSDDGRTIYDMAPVLPNTEHYVQYSYLLPIQNAQSIQQPIDYRVTGRIGFFVENSHLDFEGENLELTQRQIFNGQEYDIYEFVSPPQVGEAVTYNVTLSSTPDGTATGGISRDILALLMLIAGVVLVGSAGFIFWRGRKTDTPAPESTTTDTVIRLIAELDNAFEAGEIEKGEYQKQRNQLKAQLTRLMKQSKSDD